MYKKTEANCDVPLLASFLIPLLLWRGYLTCKPPISEVSANLFLEAMVFQDSPEYLSGLWSGRLCRNRDTNSL